MEKMKSQNAGEIYNKSLQLLEMFKKFTNKEAKCPQRGEQDKPQKLSEKNQASLGKTPIKLIYNAEEDYE
jgi:hypothetical protein